ncbi:NYN domain-containing protein [Serinicoccus chungangensis]|uniref:NYN domain-containing protein n=1 Tax=Serinicoccus chungangensis TaxID=767452 RepID=UPI001119FB4A|nr:NYN domain-containing protein [Serinicoccus chungangensis]
MATTTSRIALLIDAENAPAATIQDILAEVARHGSCNIRRAYGDWTSPQLSSWRSVLAEHALHPVQQFAYAKGKNAADISMVIDAMDILHAGQADGFAVVSSDADFTPLVMRLRHSSMQVMGFGERKAADALVSACTAFLYLDELGEEATPDAPQARRTRNQLRGDTALVRLLRGAVAATAQEDGWSHLGAVGAAIRNQSSFDERNHGYAKLSGLLEATELFEIRRTEGVVHVRDPKAVAAR